VKGWILLDGKYPALFISINPEVNIGALFLADSEHFGAA
jgi:hypothetical protein